MTPYRLAICKFLAEKMGKKLVVENGRPLELFISTEGLITGHFLFDPFTNPAQRWEVLDAAVESGILIRIGREVCAVIDANCVGHATPDNTPESRAAAVLVAIAKAWGWTDGVTA